MAEFELKVLPQYKPCSFNNRDDVIEALAITLCELVLIHRTEKATDARHVYWQL